MVIIDYEYLVNLLQDFVFTPEDADEEEVRSKVEEIRNSIAEFSQVNEKLGSMMSLIFDDMQRNRSAYFGRSIAQALEEMKRDAILRAVDGFVEKWFVDRDAVLYAVEHHRNGVLPNASILRESLRYAEYKEATEEPLRKPKARSRMIAELEQMIREEVMPLQTR
jgi:type I restriction enzyme R subunit